MSSRPATRPPSADEDRHNLPESLVDALLERVFGGTYGPGARLPAERELARELGASRVTLKYAVDQLVRLGVLAVRPRSGATVRPERDWSFEILPAVLRLGGLSPARLGKLVDEVLALRRVVLGEALGRMGAIAPESLAPAREAVRRADAARDDFGEFTRLEFEMIRALFEAADMPAAMWLSNTLRRMYVRAVQNINMAALVPERFTEVHDALFAHLEAGRGAEAKQLYTAYLEAHDATIVALFSLG